MRLYRLPLSRRKVRACPQQVAWRPGSCLKGVSGMRVWFRALRGSMLLTFARGRLCISIRSWGVLAEGKIKPRAKFLKNLARSWWRLMNWPKGADKRGNLEAMVGRLRRSWIRGENSLLSESPKKRLPSSHKIILPRRISETACRVGERGVVPQPWLLSHTWTRERVWSWDGESDGVRSSRSESSKSASKELVVERE